MNMKTNTSTDTNNNIESLQIKGLYSWSFIFLSKKVNLSKFMTKLSNCINCQASQNKNDASKHVWWGAGYVQDYTIPGFTISRVCRLLHYGNQYVSRWVMSGFSRDECDMSWAQNTMRLCEWWDVVAFFVFLKTRCLYILNSLRNVEYGDISIQQQHEKTTISSF